METNKISYNLDDIQLWHGDCLELMRDIADKSVDCIVTDPPYPTTPHGSYGSSGGMFKKELNKKGLVFNNNDCHITKWCPELYRVLKNGGHAYIMTNHKNLIEYLNVTTQCGFHFIKSLIWDKGNKIMGRFYMSQFEYILFFRKGQGIKINNCGTSDILSVPNIKTKDKDGNNIHDTEKPINLCSILIENSSKEGELILDPFMGSGTTAVACVNANRKFIGMELDDKYFNIACKRVEEAISNKQFKLF